MKYIYLDSNFWIDLGDGIRSGFQNSSIKNFYYILKELVYSGIAVCPISNAIFLELFKQKIPEERIAIASVMDELSQGFTIQSKYYLFKEEIINTSKGVSPKPWKPVSAFTTVFEEKITDTPLWKKSFARPNSLPSIKDLASTEIIGNLGKLKDFSENLASYLQDNKEKYENEAKLFKLMQGVEVLNTMDSTFEVFPELKNSVSNNFSNDINININKTMPAIWSFGSIHSLLRNDTSRKYKVNDFFDIEHCAVALGYYDCLFTERSFHSLVTHKLTSLDKRFKLICEKNYDNANNVLLKLINNA